MSFGMGVSVKQKPVKLVASLIYKEERCRESAERRLKRAYGPLEPLEKTLPFDRTDYYYGEFGRPLKRKLICFKKLFSKENISGIKLETNTLEDRFRSGVKRTVNIDPGYVTDAKLVLLTTKDYTHRIYIGKRIFAESTLFFQDGSFHPWPWTYPDYASPEIVSYFNEVRDVYLGG